MFVLLFTVHLCRHTCQHLASGYAHHLRHQTDIRQAMQPPVCHCLPPQCLPAETIGSMGALSRLGEACCALYERGQCYVLMKSV